MTPIEYTKHVRFVGILVMALLGIVSAIVFKTECCDRCTAELDRWINEL